MSASSEEYYIKMTQTPVQKLILKYSVPTILSMLVTNIYNLVDTAFVGKLGNSASGAVGVVFGFMAIIQAVGFLFGQGSGSIISRKLGHQDYEGASETASTGLFMSFLLGTIVCIICFIFLDPLVMALGSTDTIAPYAKKYIFFILITAPFNVAGFTMNNILRFEGKAVYGMIGLMTGEVLNICGDAVLMLGFDMGISGAGLSTAISQFVSFCILLSAFLRGKSQCRLSIHKLKLEIGHLGDICATGFPSLLRQGLNSVTTIILNTEASVYGDQAVAAMSIVSRISFFIFAIALGVGQGFQPVSGFNYGAGKYGRVRKAYGFTILIAEIFMVVLGTLAFFNAPMLIYMFREDMDVVEIGTRALKLQSLAVMVMPFCMATEMLMQSTGKKLGAALVSALRSGILFIPALLILSYFRGLKGIQEAQPAAYLLGVIPTAFFAWDYFRKLPAEDKGDVEQ